MGAFAPILNPSTGRRFPRRLLPIAPLLTQVCKIGVESQVPASAGAFTLLAPAAPLAGELFAITDVTGDAAANTITINGNGHTIDGAATTTLVNAFGSIVFQFDTFDSMWHRVVFARDVVDGVSTDIFMTDLEQGIAEIIPPTGVNTQDDGAPVQSPALTINFVDPLVASVVGGVTQVTTTGSVVVAALDVVLTSVAGAGAAAALTIPDGIAGLLVVRAVANEQADPGRAMFQRTLLVHASGGAAVVDAANDDGDVLNGEIWTLITSAAANAIVFTFTATGEAGDVACHLTVTSLQQGGGA